MSTLDNKPSMMSNAGLSRRQFIQLASGMTLAVALPQAWAGIEWGTHYVPVQRPQPQAADGKIEVQEFFSYTCPHCFRLESVIEPWSRRLPQDVGFRRVPVTFNEAAKFMAKVFYAADAMSLWEKLHPRLFAAIHDEHLTLVREEVLLDWLARQGVDRRKFADRMLSPCRANWHAPPSS
jgi:protein dithiol oxidoreductase (disulfide-forming)